MDQAGLITGLIAFVHFKAGRNHWEQFSPWSPEWHKQRNTI